MNAGSAIASCQAAVSSSSARDQRLGHEPAAEAAEVAGCVGLRAVTGASRSVLDGVHCGDGLGVVSRLRVLEAGCAPAATRSATAARGSSPVTSVSPTSTTSAPGLAYSITSCGPRTPDSATRTTPSGIARREPGERVPVDLEGLQVAGVDADQVGARVDARARPRPRRAPRPAGSARSTGPARCSDSSAFCSSAATISSARSAPAARASQSWYEVTMKSLRSTGTSTAARTARRSSQAAAEPSLLGEHADRGGAAGRVVGGERGRVGDRGQRALAGAGPLDLGDDAHAVGAERRHRVEASGARSGGGLEVVERDVRASRSARSARTPSRISSSTDRSPYLSVRRRRTGL